MTSVNRIAAVGASLAAVGWVDWVDWVGGACGVDVDTGIDIDVDIDVEPASARHANTALQTSATLPATPHTRVASLRRARDSATLTVAPVATFSTLFARVIVKASAPWSTIRCLQARLVPQAKLALQARLVPQAQ